MTAPAPSPVVVLGRVVVGVFVAIIVAVLLAAAWIGVRAVSAYDHLRSAQDAAATVTDSLDDPAAVEPVIAHIADDTAAARDLTSDPIWDAAEGLPWIGPQLAAVADVTAAADDLATGALQPFADVAAGLSLDALAPTDGAIDLGVFETLAPTASDAAAVTTQVRADVAAIDRSLLLAPLADPIAEIDELLVQVEDGAHALERATALIPAMLGADGARDYLVVFQNNAEWRSLGGIVGAMAQIRTDAGSLDLVDQGSSSDFTRYDDPVIDIGDDLRAVYGNRPALWVQNVTQVPDFPLAAQITQEMWARETGTTVDGVIAMDPVALSYILEATGPVDLPTGDTLTSENAVDLLLNGVYQRYEIPAEQDAFFEVAAATVFDTLANGAADPTVLLDALTRAGEQHRLLIWNADEAEQAILDGTTLQGGLPVTDAEQTSFGVYLNDGTGSKMDYYMDAEAAVAWCTDTEGEPDAGLIVTLTNDAPADAASLPRYITGGGAYDVPVGVARTLTYVYLPEGAEIVSQNTSENGSPRFSGGFDDGRQVISWTTDLAPGESASFSVRVRTPVTADLDAHLTPTVNTAETVQLAQTCEIAQ